MSVHLKRNESVGRGVKRLVRRQIDDALDDLGRPGADPDTVVHDLRKRFKRVRAVLRLVRDAVGERVYRRENACFRDAGRPLTEVRDALALVEALDQLSRRFGGRIPAQTFARVRVALAADHRAVRERVLESDDALAVVTATLKEARDRLHDWTFRHKGWSALCAGLRRTYQGGRRSLDVAAAAPSEENLHELRKRVKYLGNQLDALRPAWPDLTDGLSDRLDKLGQHLGDGHDLAALRRKLAADPRASDERLLTLIDRRRGALDREALRLSRQVFAEKPKAFTDRLRTYWKARRVGTTPAARHHNISLPNA